MSSEARVDAPVAEELERATLLDVRGLECQRGSTRAVRGVSLAVGHGETVALLGPNGAGKSSAIDGLCGLTTRRADRVSFDGHDIATARAHEIARLGLIQVSQDRDLFPGMTVRDNLELGREALGRRAAPDPARLEWILELFPRLRDRAGQRAGSLSGGEQQMLAIARALAGEPKLLVLDEPTAGLAPIVVDQLGRVLRVLAGEGLTLLLAEQNVRVALDVCERFLVMRDGQIAFDGSRPDLGPDPRAKLGGLFL